MGLNKLIFLFWYAGTSQSSHNWSKFLGESLPGSSSCSCWKGYVAIWPMLCGHMTHVMWPCDPNYNIFLPCFEFETWPNKRSICIQLPLHMGTGNVASLPHDCCIHYNNIIKYGVAYAADYRPPNVLRVELLTRKSYEHGTCTSWKSVLYPSKWCLFQWAAIYSRWAVLYTIEVSFDQSSTTRTYYRLCIW